MLAQVTIAGVRWCGFTVTESSTTCNDSFLSPCLCEIDTSDSCGRMTLCYRHQRVSARRECESVRRGCESVRRRCENVRRGCGNVRRGCGSV